jgi:uncharacterized protein (TIGR02145 family)
MEKVKTMILLVAAALMWASCDNNDRDGSMEQGLMYPDLGESIVAVNAVTQVENEATTRVAAAEPIRFEQTLDDGTTIESTLTEVTPPRTRTALGERTRLLMIAYRGGDQPLKYQTFEAGTDSIQIWLPAGEAFKLAFFSMNDTTKIDIADYIDKPTQPINDNADRYGGLIAMGSHLKTVDIARQGTDALWAVVETGVIGQPDAIGKITLKHLFCRLNSWTIATKNGGNIDTCSAQLISAFAAAKVDIARIVDAAEADSIWSAAGAKEDTIALPFAAHAFGKSAAVMDGPVNFIPQPNKPARIRVNKFIVSNDPLSRYVKPKTLTFDKAAATLTPGKSYKLESKLSSALKVMVSLRGQEKLDDDGNASGYDRTAENAGIHTASEKKITCALNASGPFFVVGWYAIKLGEKGDTISVTRIKHDEVDENVPNAAAGDYSTARQTLDITVDKQNANTIYEGRVIAFAGSNIYWNRPGQETPSDGTLLFAGENEHDKPSPTSESDINEQLTGIYYKFGSLMGTSPSTKDWNNRSLNYFTPESGGGWKNNPNDSGEKPTWDLSTDIPYFAGECDGSGSAFVYEGDPYETCVGDICAFISKGWRLPTAEEFDIVARSWTFPEESSRFSIKDSSWGLETSPKKDKGTAYLTSGGGERIGFAMSGYRQSGGAVPSASSGQRPGKYSGYWTASGVSGDTTNAYCLEIRSTAAGIGTATTQAVANRQIGLPVRCVRE